MSKSLISPITPDEHEIKRNLVAVCLGLSLAYIVQSMMLIAVPLYSLQLGATPLFVGVIVSAPYFFPLIFAIPLGGTTAKLGGRKAMIIGGAGMLTGPILLIASPGYASLIASQVLMGIAQLILLLATQAIIADLASGKALEKNFGWYTTSISGGQLAGPLVAGWLIDNVTMQATFIAMSILAFIAMFSGFLLVGAARQGQEISKVHSGYRAQGKLLQTNRAVQVSIIVSLGAVFAMSAHASFLPIYLDSIAISATAIGALVSFRALCSMAIRPFMSSIIDNVGGRAATMTFCLILTGTGLMFTGMSSNIYILAILALLIGIGGGISQPLSMVILSDHVRPEQRSSALGMRLMTVRGTQFLAPLMLGLLAEATGFAGAFILGGLLVVAVIGILNKFLPEFKELEETKVQ